MISKSDWQTAYDQILDEGRKRLSPPTVEEMEALQEGRLSEAEADRVREQLSYYPELVRVMTEPVPADAAGLVSDEEVAAGLAALRERIRRERAPERAPTPIHPRRPRRQILTRAAVVIILIGGGALLAYRMLNRFEGTPVMLSADGQLSGRGEQTPHQLSTETDYVLRPAFRPERAYRSYRLQLVDLSGDVPRSIETWNGVERAEDGAYPVELSTKGFAEGRYQLVLYGIDGQAVRLASYTIRLTAP
jgi:hypothetical protein